MLQRRYSTLLLLFLLCACVRAQELYNYFEHMTAQSVKLDFITNHGEMVKSTEDGERLKSRFATEEGLTEMPFPLLRIGYDTVAINQGETVLHLTSPTGSEWLTLHTFGPDVSRPAEVMWQAIGRYCGQQYDNACLYLKLGASQKSTLQATALIGRQVISAGIEFPFSMPAYGISPSPEQQEAYETAARKMHQRIDLLREYLVPGHQQIYAARPELPLTAAEKTFGLVQFWTEAKYNFAYFDQVPGLNWDAALQEYLPLVTATTDDAAYYRLLEKFCALLGDGHTNVYPPTHLQRLWDRPQLQIEYVGGTPVVVNRKATIGDLVPLGSQIVAVEGLTTADHLRKNIFPYISCGSDHVRNRWGAHDVLKGPAATEVSFEILTPAGERRLVSLMRDRDNSGGEWEIKEPIQHLTSLEVLDGNIGHLTLNSFNNNHTVSEFLEYLPQIRQCTALVIDLRNNGGGNSEIGYQVLKHFMDKPLLTSAWRTREHRAASKAWGQFSAKDDPASWSTWERENVKMYRGEAWYQGRADTITPAENALAELPVAVLVSNYTASAAEDFLVAADALENFTFVGEPSFGSTGQPLMLPLPGGGSARICTKRDTYADGREFVGPGVKVDIAVAPTVEEYVSKIDVVLERALELFN